MSKDPFFLQVTLSFGFEAAELQAIRPATEEMLKRWMAENQAAHADKMFILRTAELLKVQNRYCTRGIFGKKSTRMCHSSIQGVENAARVIHSAAVYRAPSCCHHADIIVPPF